MPVKAFFKERTPAQIRKLERRTTTISKNLVERIQDLDPVSDMLEIRTRIIPGKYFQRNATGTQASRKAYKHGEYGMLPQPTTVKDSLSEPNLPHQWREVVYDNLRHMNQRDIVMQGTRFRPIHGSDKRTRHIPFAWIMEAARLFAYAMSETQGIPIKPYDDAQRVDVEGASAIVDVPSRTPKEPRYSMRLHGIPVIDHPMKHAVALGFGSTYMDGKVPTHSLFNIGYKYATDRRDTHLVIAYPHDIAALTATARHYMVEEENTTPWDMNIFAKPSLADANFYRTLCNNVLIYDPSLRSKEQTRKLHVPEKSILMARHIGEGKEGEHMYWQAGRDPKLQDYDWSIPGV